MRTPRIPAIRRNSNRRTVFGRGPEHCSKVAPQFPRFGPDSAQSGYFGADVPSWPVLTNIWPDCWPMLAKCRQTVHQISTKVDQIWSKLAQVWSSSTKVRPKCGQCRPIFAKYLSTWPNSVQLWPNTTKLDRMRAESRLPESNFVFDNFRARRGSYNNDSNIISAIMVVVRTAGIPRPSPRKVTPAIPARSEVAEKVPKVAENVARGRRWGKC